MLPRRPLSDVRPMPRRNHDDHYDRRHFSGRGIATSAADPAERRRPDTRHARHLGLERRCSHRGPVRHGSRTRSTGGGQPIMTKTWGGRFTGTTDNRVEAFTESISFDQRLYKHDILASQAHARMLGEVGLLTSDEAAKIVAALDDIGAEIARGEFAFSIQLEDIHTHIEQALIARLGDVGRKLHTGRSRNDQVATDVKLWVRSAIDEMDGRLVALQIALLAAAERERDLILPGY